jgi:dipeptidase E
MKLVLTSGGISNKSIEKELKNIIGKDFKDLKMLFCITASNYIGGEINEWLIKDLEHLTNLGFKIDICDINGISIEKFLPRFEWADVYYFEGGITQWLRKCIKDSGLEKHLIKLLKTRVWIGASAGSCVLCPTVCNSCQDLFDENIKGYPVDGLGFIDFQFVPHLNNEWFPKIREDNLQNASKNLKKIDGKKLYVIDDNGAVFVDNKNVKVVSEGKWFEV